MDEGRVTRAAAQAADLAREQEENKTGSNGSNLSEKLDMIAETLTEMTRQQSQIIQALAGGNSENQTVPAFVSSVNRTPATAHREPPEVMLHHGGANNQSHSCRRVSSVKSGNTLELQRQSLMESQTMKEVSFGFSSGDGTMMCICPSPKTLVERSTSSTS